MSLMSTCVRESSLNLTFFGLLKLSVFADRKLNSKSFVSHKLEFLMDKLIGKRVVTREVHSGQMAVSAIWP